MKNLILNLEKQEKVCTMCANKELVLDYKKL